MELSANGLTEYLSSSCLQFVNGFTNTLKAGKIDTGRKTAFDVCGLVIPIKGHAKFSFNGNSYYPNSQTILHAGSSMDICIETSEEDWSFAVIHYRIVHTTKEFENFLHQHFSIPIDEPSKPLLLAQQLLQQQTKPDHFSKFQMQVLFMNLLESIVIGARNRQHDEKLQAITGSLEYIHKNFAKELSISEIAHRFGFERRRFSALFEQVTGLTPSQYVTEYRMKRAKELLMLSGDSIVEIAEAVGYQDSFYFSRVFKKHVGLPPSIYRKKVEKNSIFR